MQSGLYKRDPMITKRGARFRVREATRATCLVSWAAPFTPGYDVILPPGEIFAVAHNLVPEASAVACEPLRGDALHGYFVDERTRRARGYSGYQLVVDLQRIREACDLLEPGAEDASILVPEEDPWSTTAGSVRDDKVIGCLLGTAVGDALGLPYEGMSRRRIEKLAGALDGYRFLFRRGMVSDDTEHACLVAQSLIDSGGDDERFLRALAWRLRGWLLALPAGTGLATLRAGIKLLVGVSPKRSGVWSAGDGPAMRAPIIGVVYGAKRERLGRLVRACTRITHTDPRAEHGALAVAVAAWLASCPRRSTPERFMSAVRCVLTLDEAGELLRYLYLAAESAAAGETTSAFAERLGLNKGVSGYVCHTVPVALHAWLRHPNDYAAAVTGVIRCGGDTDSLAAITGGIVGAGTGPEGISSAWLRGLWEWPRSVGWMTRLGHQLAQNATADHPASAPRVSPLAVLLRNVLFMFVVLAHGLRRLLPPY